MSQDIKVRAGATWRFVLTLDDNGKPFPMEGAAVQVRIRSPKGDKVITATIGAGIEVLDQAKAEVLVEITPAMQGDFPTGIGRYEARARSADGLVLDQASGPFHVQASLFASDNP